MNTQYNIDNIIAKDVHCPYCDSANAVLLNKTSSRKFAFQLPAFGLKFVLSLLYLSIIHICINGFKLFETIKTIDNVTYVFCPNCGNSYSMAPPEQILPMYSVRIAVTAIQWRHLNKSRTKLNRRSFTE